MKTGTSISAIASTPAASRIHTAFVAAPRIRWRPANANRAPDNNSQARNGARKKLAAVDRSKTHWLATGEAPVNPSRIIATRLTPNRQHETASSGKKI